MVLLVAVKESRARIIGGKLNLNLRLRIHQNYILDDPMGLQVPSQPAQLETVPMQMNRMIVGAVVLELQPVTLTLMKRHSVGIRKGLPINHPMIERTMPGKLRLKDQRNVDNVYRT